MGRLRAGVVCTKTYAAVTMPYYHTVVAYPFAWTKGTGGPIKAEVMQIPRSIRMS